MDKRFEKVIEKLENQAASAIETNKKLEKVFKEVNVAQKGTDGKLVEIQKDLDKVINAFKENSKKQIDVFLMEVENIKEKGSTAYDELSELNDKIKKDYETKVGGLIKDIDSKSDEILTIFQELEKIKSIQNSAEKSLMKNSDDHQNALEDLKKESEKILSNMNISKLANELNSFAQRIAKLEKHAHTHTFGGSKI